MNDDPNELRDADADASDQDLRAFLAWRAATGARPRGSSETARAIAGRLAGSDERERSPWRVGVALGSAAIVLVVAITAAAVFLGVPAVGPATSASPSPTASRVPSQVPSLAPSHSQLPPGQCPPRGEFVAGAASTDQQADLFAMRLEGDIGTGAVVFPTQVNPGSAGQRELWYADANLESPRLIASLGPGDAIGTDGEYGIYVEQIAANRSAALVEILAPLAGEDMSSICAEWYLVSTSATEARVTSVAGPGEDVITAAISPDGTRVAFVMYDEADGIGNAHVEVRDGTGASLGSTPLVPAIHPVLAWSPDSAQVAVASGTWAAVRPAAATNWGDTLVITGLDGEPESVVWPTASGSAIVAFAKRNEAADGFVGFAVATLTQQHQFLETLGEDGSSWAPRVELSPDGTHLRASHFVAGDYVDVTIDVTATDPSITDLSSDFDAQYPLVDWQWSRDSGAIEQTAAIDDGVQIVSVPIDATSPESVLVTFTDLTGDDHEREIGKIAWIGP